ncbi:MAG: hypothetical protein QM784_35460 [Polyangiaceae bacterium]
MCHARRLERACHRTHFLASVLDEVVVTNTIPPSPTTAACSKVKYLSTGKLLGEAIRRIHNAESVSSLFV